MALLFLTGFMGSGKSRIGRELAALLGLRFVDLDRVIEQRVGPITPFFKREGEAAFRDVERQVLRELVKETGAVIATGGGTPFQLDNMERMLAAGTVIHLDVPLSILAERLKRIGRDRPLLFGLTDAQLEEKVGGLFALRRPGYLRAHHVIDADALPEVVARRIADAIDRPVSGSNGDR